MFFLEVLVIVGIVISVILWLIQMAQRMDHVRDSGSRNCSQSNTRAKARCTARVIYPIKLPVCIFCVSVVLLAVAKIVPCF